MYYPFVLLRRDEGTSVNGIFTTLTGEIDTNLILHGIGTEQCLVGVVLLVQMVMNIANSNNNENKKNENNQNNNNNNNVNTFDNIFVSMNENMQSANMMTMCNGMVCTRQFPDGATSHQSKLMSIYYEELKYVLNKVQAQESYENK